MDTLKKIGTKIKVILTQLIAFILSFFKKEENKPKTKVEEVNKTIDKEDKKDEKINIDVDINVPYPDEPDTKTDTHLTYKQAISSIEPEKKEEIKSKVQTKEIYFSEIVVINTIVEIIEEKNDFIFSDLSETKKDKVKIEIEKLKEKIIPPLKKEMLNNKIKTKEELKTNLTKRINNIYYTNNPIKKILNEKENTIYIEEETKNNEKIKIENEEPKVEEIKDKKIITITPRKKEKNNENKKDFISIEKNKISKEDRIYFIADIVNDEKKELKLPEVVKTDTQKNLISDADKKIGLAIAVKSTKIPFKMVPTDTRNKPPVEERIKNAIVDTSLLEEKKEKEKEEEVEEEIAIEEKRMPKIYISDEDTISPEEKKIADIAVDREILEEIREDLKKQQINNLDYINKPLKVGISEEKEEPKVEEIKDDTSLLDKIEEERKEILDKIEELEKTIEEKEETKIERETKEEDHNIIFPISKEEEKEKELIDMNEDIDYSKQNIELPTQLTDEKELNEDKIDSEALNNDDDINIILPIKKDESEEQEEIENEQEEKEPKAYEETAVEEENDKKESKEISVPLTIVTNENNKYNKDYKETKEIKKIYRNTESLIINTNNEIKKEEFEDKDYDSYAKQIDDLLYSIEMYKIKNEDNITPSEREKLNQEKNKLKTLKIKLETQKENDIAKEKKELEAELTENEIKNIQKEIEQLHIEHQEEANEDLINQLTKMEAENDERLAEIEQQLIKSKLKKASKAIEIPSLLALPFIRHKYFFYFTIGLFVNNHFNFLNAIFKRKNMKYEPIDLSEIKNGYDALDKAIDQTYENMVYLDYLENESITKYPNLKNDKEFNKYIEKLRTKLNYNYNKLQKKQKMINKYIKKADHKNKVLKKYRLVKDNKAA